MNKVQAAKVLVNQIGDEAEVNEALKVALTTILDTFVVKAKEPPKAVTKAPAKPKGRRSKFDLGKAQACKKAGWPDAKIADELGCSVSTVQKHLKEAKA